MLIIDQVDLSTDYTALNLTNTPDVTIVLCFVANSLTKIIVLLPRTIII
jgi:hypothetical protein